MFISVDLPEPDEPMMATNSPGWTVRLMPRSASTLTSPMTNVRATSSTLITGSSLADPRMALGTISKARLQQTGLAARLTAAFGGDDLIAWMEIAADDFRKVVVAQTGND